MNLLDLQNVPLSGVSLIEASAGTGKTFTISQLVLRFILTAQDGLKERPLRIEEILVVTFTKAATQELKDRIRQNIGAGLDYLDKPEEKHDATLMAIIDKALAEASDAVIYQRLKQALLFLDDAPIFTIHGFCQRILSDYSFSTGQAYNQQLQESSVSIEHRISEKLWRQWLYPATKKEAAYFIDIFKSPDSLRSKLSRSLATDLIDEEAYRLKDLDATRPGFAVVADQLKLIDKLYTEACELWRVDKEAIESSFNGGMGRSFTKANLPRWLVDLHLYLTQPENSLAGFHLAQRFTQLNIDEKIAKSPPQHRLFACLEEMEVQINSLEAIVLSQLRQQFIDEVCLTQQQQNILFFDDLVKRLATAVSSSDDTAKALIEDLRLHYPAALIDEFQDTDQWQYSIFAQIYAANSSDLSPTSCLMIGDPKQAIYSFRGADINSYFLARSQVQAEKRYTLATNYRSAPALVANVNRLFMQQDDAFCIEDFPNYPEVQSPEFFSNKQGLRLNDSNKDCNFSVIKIEGDSKTKVEDLRQQAADKTATFIANTLANKKLIDGVKIEPADIAILVRSSKQAALMKKTLLEHGVNSVYLSKESVLESLEALSFLQILKAMANPYEQSMVLTAVAGELISYGAEDIQTLNRQSESSATIQHCFIHAHKVWMNKGFMPAWQYMCEYFDITQKLLSLYEGERRVTNLIQLAEHFQTLDANKLALWQKIELFQQQIDDAEEDDAQQKLRLETEANLVQIVTIHKSKGLEYPMVCCPFLFDPGKSVASMFTLCFDKHSHQRKLYWNATDVVKQQVKNEQFAEDIRLLYVALTRAANHFNCCWGAVKGVEKTALYHLLYGRQNSLKTLPEGDFWQRFLMLNGLAFDPQEEVAVSHRRVEDNMSQSSSRLQARNFTRRLQSHYVARSYSALLNSQPHHLQVNDEGRERDEDAEPVQMLPEPAFNWDIFHFPKGSDAGNFMHQVLEDLSFTDAEATLPNLLPDLLEKYGFPIDWQAAIAEHFLLCLSKPLGQDSPSLESLTDANICKEMAFYLQAQPHSGSEFVHILQRYRDWLSQETGIKSLPVKQGFCDVAGLFKGFIDLVYEYQGQFYVLDYKSNFLGFSEKDYAPEKMREAMESHFYDLQFLIYLAALQRHLKQRLKNYDYNKHIGSAQYVFLRGINNQNNNGIYSIKPPQIIIDELESLFLGHVYD